VDALGQAGRLRNNNYTNGEGNEVYGFGFTCEELDYLDSKAESDARRARQGGDEPPSEGESTAPAGKAPRGRAGRSAGKSRT
jgi:single-strand DNA-binding protein